MPSPVKQEALKHNIPVYQPLSLKDEEAQAELKSLNADLMIVAAYGLILPKAVLEIPAYGCINIHASLLPRWRGAAPIQRAIQAVDKETRITIMQMDVGLYTGDMLLKERCHIADNATGGSLHDELAEMGARCILNYLQQRDTLNPEPQDNALATYAHKLSKNEACIDWSEDAQSIARAVRAFNPWPVSYTNQDETRVRILEAQAQDSADKASPGQVLSKSKDGIVVQCGKGALTVTRLQLAGSKAVSVNDFVNGGKALFETNSQLH